MSRKFIDLMKKHKIILAGTAIALVAVLFFIKTPEEELKVRLVVNGEMSRPIYVAYFVKNGDEVSAYNMELKEPGMHTVATLPAGVYRINFSDRGNTDPDLFCINTYYEKLNSNELTVVVESGKQNRLPDIIVCRRINPLNPSVFSQSKSGYLLRWSKVDVAGVKYKMFINKDVDFSKSESLDYDPVQLSYDNLETNELFVAGNEDSRYLKRKNGDINSGLYTWHIIAYKGLCEYSNFQGISLSGAGSGFKVVK